MKWFLMMLFLSLLGCGGDTRTVEYVPTEPDDPGGGDGGGGGSQALNYGQMQGLLNNYCASCHASAQFMQSQNALVGSSVRDRLWNNSMPPSNAGKKLPDRERQLMLSFF